MLTNGYDFRAYDASEHDSRNRFGEGYKHSSFDMGLNTYIGGRKDGNGNDLTIETQANMRRLQRRDNRTKINESATRNLLVAMSELDRIITEMRLPDTVKEEAALIYRKALTLGLIRGRSIDAFIAASIYAACRMLRVPRPLVDIVEISKREPGEVGRSYRMLMRELKMRPPVDDPFKFISSIASKAGLDREVERRAVEILHEAKALHLLSGKDPRGIAGGALYLACEYLDVKVVQGKVAKAADVTGITLRNRYKGLKSGLLA